MTRAWRSETQNVSFKRAHKGQTSTIIKRKKNMALTIRRLALRQS